MTERATPAQIVATLAELAPDSQPVLDLDVPSSDRARMPLAYTAVFERTWTGATRNSPWSGLPVDVGSIAPIVKRARLAADENLLRVGWLWVVGVDEAGKPFTTPLVSLRVRTSSDLGNVFGLALSSPTIGLRSDGEIELSPLIIDRQERQALEQTVAVGGGGFAFSDTVFPSPAILAKMPQLTAWAERACRAAGLPRPRLVGRESEAEPRSPGVCHVVVQVQLYVARPAPRPVTVAATLRSWLDHPLDGTALAAVYGDGSDRVEQADVDVTSPLPLTSAQRSVVVRSRGEAVTVVSGAPGSGKSQAVAAIALDAVARDASVLVAVPSDAAAEALLALLERVPAVEPIVFGSSDHRLRVADRLGQGGGALASDDELERRRRAFADAGRRADALRGSVLELLTAEQLAADADPTRTMLARRAAPRWFEASADLVRAERLLHRAEQPVSGLFSGYRRRRRHRALRSDAGTTETSYEALGDALRNARAVRAVAELESAGGLDLTATWPRVIDAEAQRQIAHTDWLDATSRAADRIDRPARSTMALVAAALRSGRSTRRDKLAEIDGRQLTAALPMWLGTLRDIDDLLPATPGMFDLVIVDEASQVDQIAAAPALLRGRRAVVVGDPKQLRHVSFLADAQVEAAQLQHGVLDPTDRGRLDVRRLSVFDLAASAAPTTVLDEHFRSAPHLIGFSMRRFYDGTVSVATTHPRNDGLDCIDVEHVEGRRSEAGINQVEVHRAVEIVREHVDVAMHGGESRTVGIVTPFRAQADEIAQAVIDAFTLAEIDAVRLRVGTVHGFQGCERDLVVISAALDDDSPAGSRAFLGDPNLFNVMVTRARHRVIVLVSTTRVDGLLGEYVRWGEAGPQTPASVPTGQRALDELRRELVAAGLLVRAGYPAGKHRLDLVIGDGEQAFGVTYGVHPDGPGAHVERRLALEAQGWDVFEVFESRWRDRPAELALELVHESRARGLC